MLANVYAKIICCWEFIEDRLIRNGYLQIYAGLKLLVYAKKKPSLLRAEER